MFFSKGQLIKNKTIFLELNEWSQVIILLFSAHDTKMIENVAANAWFITYITDNDNK